MSAIRPLPPRPSLEYARKEAKALLRRLRAGDPEAISRAAARHPPLGRTPPPDFRLSDAQLVLAREHGFASWPRLVRYVGDVERQQHGHAQVHFDPEYYEREAGRLVESHRARRPMAGRTLAAYVPRFYGLRPEEVFEAEVSEDEARLAVARGYGAPSWEVFVERLEHNARTRPADEALDPFRDAADAIRDADVGAIERVVAAHPALLTPSEYDISASRTLMALALAQERKQGAAAIRPIMEWLAARGLDRQRELNERLCRSGIGLRGPEWVRELLDQGADPDWVGPNGIPVLEHALLRYWDGAAVDVIAERVTPRKALWIAAGLGDVDGVREFLDRDGRPTAAARRLRPDLVAVGGPGWPQLPDADDEEILFEALFVAVVNGRARVIEYLASRGAPVDSTMLGMRLVAFAGGNGMIPAFEALVRSGADLDLRGGERQSVREMARELFEQAPESPQRRRVLELCGMDPDAVLAERNARPAPEPFVIPGLRKVIGFASMDAARRGQTEVRPENLLVGLLRSGVAPYHVLMDMQVDVRRIRSEMAERVPPPADGAAPPELPMDAEAREAWDATIAHATSLRRMEVTGVDLLHTLTRPGDGPVPELLSRYGVNVGALHEKLAASLQPTS